MRRSVQAWLYGESRYSSRKSALASKASTDSPSYALRVRPRRADGDRVLAAQRHDELAGVDLLADHRLDAVDHRRGVAGVHRELRQRVDAQAVRLHVDPDVVQLHVPGRLDDRPRPLAGADPAGRRAVVRHRHHHHARPLVRRVLGSSQAKLRAGVKRSSGIRLDKLSL